MTRGTTPWFSARRDFITPATAIVFLVVGISGMMMFFHVGNNLVKSAHEWLGIAFVALSAWHVVRHAKTFMNYLRRPQPRLVLAGVAVLSLLVVGVTARPEGGLSPRTVFRSLESAPLATVAQVVGTDEAGVRLALAGKGIDVGSAATLGDVAQRTGADPLMLMATVYAAAPRP